LLIELRVGQEVLSLIFPIIHSVNDDGKSSVAHIVELVHKGVVKGNS